MAVLHHPELKSSRFILGSGSGTRWPEIDEDISVAGMLHDIPPEGLLDNAKRLPYACQLALLLLRQAAPARGEWTAIPRRGARGLHRPGVHLRALRPDVRGLPAPARSNTNPSGS